MKLSRSNSQTGSALIVAMSAILIISIIAAGVLMNCTTRYNTTSKQVKAWKEALVAAEAGADLAFAEVRKNGLDSTQGFATSGNWASPAPSPISASVSSWELGYTNAGPSFGSGNSLSAKITVDRFAMLPGSSTYGYYRIRSVGSAQLGGLRRTGMDDRVNTTTRGDSLLRKIDYSYDHFISTYGYGDALATAAGTSSNGKSLTTVSSPQISRRVELIAIPVMPIQGAVQTSGAFSFPLVDSYDSQYGAYPGSTPAAAPYNQASGQGNVADGSSTFSGTVYGDVTTNGGSASSNKVSGVIDNNVPLSPVSNLPCTPGTYTATPAGDITPPAQVISAVSPYNYQQQTTFWYHYSSLGSININPAPALYSTGLPTGGVIETNVNIVVDGDVTGNSITVGKGVIAKIYFSGNVSGKANSYNNGNVDGPQTLGVTTNPVVIPGYRSFGDATTTNASKTVTSASASFTASDVGKQIVGAGIPSGATIASVTNSTTAVLSANATASSSANTAATIMTGYTASTNVSASSHFWVIGEGVNQTITLGSGSPDTEYVVWYAPNADFTVNGNPDFVGAAVVKSFRGNGNNTFHYDLELATAGTATDYRVASFVEDVR